jgi:hypothetical protein
MIRPSLLVCGGTFAVSALMVVGCGDSTGIGGTTPAALSEALASAEGSGWTLLRRTVYLNPQ